MKIKRVSVEFLRPGPPQNQLLSPLTPYLVTCGDSGAGVVHVPYEHAEFERRLKELRYETGDPEDRLAMLNSMGEAMGRMLGGVPGLPGSLAPEPDARDLLVHLRLTVSASELALLPLELVRTPMTATMTGEGWVAVRAWPPVCVTRNVRGVSSDGVSWPDTPRILFISGDKANVPYAEHERILLDAIGPFRYPNKAERRQTAAGRVEYGNLLTILENPTLSDVQDECRRVKYTHVHVLAHGDLSNSASDAFGIVLRDARGAQDVVTGDRFACALCPMMQDGVHWPTVVTIASCDIANVGSVLVPGASFAHALHHARIPLVVASQFPLSIEGSISLTRAVYSEILWGEHPLGTLHRARCELHVRHSVEWHDWASLVVYEALPQDLNAGLEALRYRQAKTAMNAALEHIDKRVAQSGNEGESLKSLEERVEVALEKLPLSGEYGVECIGLRASARKRLAQTVFAVNQTADATALDWHRDEFAYLSKALQDYEQAVRWLMTNDRHAVQRIATLHWVMVQVESMRAVLGLPGDDAFWNVAELSAKFYLDAPDRQERAWAHGSLAELYLLQLARVPGERQDRDLWAEKACEAASEIVKLYPSRDDFAVLSTHRQFERYVTWWGARPFVDSLEKRLRKRQVAWDAPLGLIETARAVMEILVPSRGNGGSSSSVPPSPDSRPGGGGVQSAARESSGTAPSTVATRIQEASPDAPDVGDAALAAPKDRGRLLQRSISDAFFDVSVLPAGHGDCIWIEYGARDRVHRVIVDCGTPKTGESLVERVRALAPRDREFELFVMTHIDADHLGGALPFLKVMSAGATFGDVWFNGWGHVSGSLGARQGEMFSTALDDFNLPWNAAFGRKAVVTDGSTLPEVTLPGGLKLTLLSPTRETLSKLAPAWARELKKAGLVPGGRVDYKRFLKGKPSTSTDVDALAETPFKSDAAPANGASIAFLAEYEGAGILLGADAHAPVLQASIRKLLSDRGIERLPLNAFKLPHHGSQNNVSKELLQLLFCKRYLVSTNGDYFSHPDREAIARVIKYGGGQPELYFNYRSAFNEVWARKDLQEKYGYSARLEEEGFIPLLNRRG